MPGRSKEDIEREHKKVEHHPEDLKDTDVEDEYSNGTKKGFQQPENVQQGKEVSGHTMRSAPVRNRNQPSNMELKMENQKIKHRPEDLKDTDVEDEYKSEGGKFKKNTNKARL